MKYNHTGTVICSFPKPWVTLVSANFKMIDFHSFLFFKIDKFCFESRSLFVSVPLLCKNKTF